MEPENTYALPVQKEECNPEQITKTIVSCTLESDCNLSCNGQWKTGGFICKDPLEWK